MKRVTVVIPVYNRAHSIRSALESVFRQTVDLFEVIVVDDGSTDETLSVLSKYKHPKLKIIEQKSNKGVSAARNVGIKEAKGDFVAFQDSDDEWLPKKIELQLKKIESSSKNTCAVYCGMIILNNKMIENVRQEIRYYPSEVKVNLSGNLLNSLLRHSLISTQTLMVDRQTLIAVGGFDEALPALVDWDLVIRLASHGSIAFVNEPLVIQRFSKNSITHSNIKKLQSHERIFWKNYDAIKNINGLLAHHCQIMSGGYRKINEFEKSKEMIKVAIKYNYLNMKNYIFLMKSILKLK